MSGDSALGIPYNIACYALLVELVAQCTNMIPGEFIHTIGDAHIYKNHIANLEKQLKVKEYPLPTISLNSAIENIFDFKLEDITLHDYKSGPAIKYDVAV